MVSIIVPLFNRFKLVKETIKSIQDQSYTNWELIIVDDGSTDGSHKVVRDFAHKDNRIQLYKRDRKPKGAPTCRNIGFEKSTGEYVVFLDSDDLLASWCLENRVQVFEDKPQYDFLVFMVKGFYKKPDDWDKLWNIQTDIPDLVRFFNIDPPWQTTSPIFKRSYLEKLGSWDEAALDWQDWEFHVRAITSGAKYFISSEKADAYIRRFVGERISDDGYSNGKKLNSKYNLFKIHYPLAQQVLSANHQQLLRQAIKNTILTICSNAANNKNATLLSIIKLYSINIKFKTESILQSFLAILFLSLLKLVHLEALKKRLMNRRQYFIYEDKLERFFFQKKEENYLK